ncbi:MAG TPA: hypothetical protein ENN41_08385 [Sediminispirochaeta sp.]|nr:hypothetical protein [Sediminispirochaeta sp.]
MRLTVLLMLVLYIAIAPEQVQREEPLLQEWVRDIDGSSAREELEREWVPFLLQDYYGYISPGGDRFFSMELNRFSAIESTSFCRYDPTRESLLIEDPFHELLYPINYTGIPYVKRETYFIVSYDFSSFLAVSREGKRLLHGSFSSPITCLDRGGDYIGVGLLDGDAYLYDESGLERAHIQSSDSRIEAVYGTALSADGRYWAIIHGLDPQLVSVYQLRGDDPKRLRVFAIDGELRRQVVISFSEDGAYVLVETPKGAKILPVQEPFKEASISFSGDLVDFVFEGDGKMLHVVTRDLERQRSHLRSYLPDGSLYNEEEFEGKAVGITATDAALYLGIENRVIKIARKESGDA